MKIFLLSMFVFSSVCVQAKVEKKINRKPAENVECPLYKGADWAGQVDHRISNAVCSEALMIAGACIKYLTDRDGKDPELTTVGGFYQSAHEACKKQFESTPLSK